MSIHRAPWLFRLLGDRRASFFRDEFAADTGNLAAMCVWRTLFTVLALGLSACSFTPPADVGDDDVADDDGGDDADGGPDGAVDGAARVFIGTICCAEPSAVYVATVEDGVPTTATPVTPSGKVQAKYVSAAGDVVFYTDDSLTAGVHQLYRVRIGEQGPETPQLASGNHGGGSSLFSTFFAPDVSRVVYQWARVVEGGGFVTDQYYFVDLSGAEPGDPIPLTGGASPAFGQLSRDGRKFVFAESRGVYLVDVSGTTPSAPLTVSAANAEAEILTLHISPTSDKVSFVADLTTNGVYEAYVVDISGATPGAVERASAPLATGEDVLYPDLFYGTGTPPTFTPDGNKLVYLVSDSSGIVKALYVVDVSGVAPGTAHRANDVPVSGGAFDVSLFGGQTFVITDNGHLVYRIDQRFDDVFELFRVDISGALPGPTQRISGALAAGGDVGTIIGAPDGSGLIYVADQRTDAVNELFYVDLRGAQPAAPVPVNQTLPAGGNVTLAGFTPDSASVVWNADAETDDSYDAYIADVSTGVPGTPNRVTPTSLGPVYFPPTIAPDSAAIYWLEQYGTGMAELWVAPLDGAVPGTPMEFDLPGGVATLWLR
jgi:hypothetical protein